MNLEHVKDDSGKFLRYAWPGHYPLFYIDKQGNWICPDCANRPVDQSQDVIDYGVNWENPNIYCEDCGARIASAYGEDEEEHKP